VLSGTFSLKRAEVALSELTSLQSDLEAILERDEVVLSRTFSLKRAEVASSELTLAQKVVSWSLLVISCTN